MASYVYLLCAGTALLSSILLFRGYRQTKTRLLFWSGLCFAFFALDNALLFIDLIIVPDANFILWRLPTALFGIACLLYGLVWETR